MDEVAKFEVEYLERGLNLGVVLHGARARDDGARVRALDFDDATARVHAVGRGTEPVVVVMNLESKRETRRRLLEL